MKKIYYIIFMCTIGLSAHSSDKLSGLIPKPLKMQIGNGQFLLSSSTVINAAADDVNAILLNDYLRSAYGLTLKIKPSGKESAGINLIYDVATTGEAYRLSVAGQTVTIKGSRAGVFYGLQTLMQLSPTKVDDGGVVPVPEVDITDEPRFSYRGAMLDAGRYFFPVEEVKRFIDLMAFYKLNIFHWHLTEDGGWRIEIKKYPELTRIGAWRRGTDESRSPDGFDRLPHGGYYTQQQVRDVVRYARDRNITIIPEIDMPGHIVSALAAYPHLSCTGGPFHVLEHWGIQPDILCAGNEEVYTFINDVMDELIELFPSEIIHVGGDEAPKQRWEKCPLCQAKIKSEHLQNEHELQSYFIRRVAAHLNSKGRKLLGWEEIMEGGLAPNAMVMSWKGVEAGIEASGQHHEVVMAPSTYLYIDYYQGESTREPYNIGGFLPLKTVYDYEPLSDRIPAENQKYIIGVQGNLWMEYIHTVTKNDYMAFPRLIALAEKGWSVREKDYDDFTRRLAGNLLWLDQKGVNYRIPEPYGLAGDRTTNGGNSVHLDLRSPVEGAEIFYTVDGSDPMLRGKKYETPLDIDVSSGTTVFNCIVRTPVGHVSATYTATYTKGWTKAQAAAWYKKQGWLRGSNFTPSTAINQLEMWQAETFDPVTIDRELGWAAGIGLNCMRVYLHHVAWEVDKAGFKQRLKDYLAIADKHGIKTVFVLLDDCWNATYKAGIQPKPLPGIHNSGWVRDPGDLIFTDPSLVNLLEVYVKDVLTEFKDDPRILLWDLYNEPGNSGYGNKSLPLLKKVYEWAFAVRPSQPVSAGVYDHNLTEMSQFQLANSDVTTYHNYSNPEDHKNCIDTLRRYGRPLICTEYMARRNNSLFTNIMPLLKKERTGAINWGLVDGKTNTKYAWGEPVAKGAEPPLWFCEIFRRDGTPYRQEEVDVIKKLCLP